MRSVVFDSQSLLRLYLGEPGSEKVVALLRQVLDREMHGHLNVVNLAEVYYILRRKSGKVADEKEENLRSYGVRIVPVDPQASLWKRAASLKAEHAMSLADSFAASTALELKCRLVTGADREFDGIPGLDVERV